MGIFEERSFLDGTFWLFKGDRSRYLAFFLLQILLHHEHLRTRFAHFLSHGRLLASAQHQRHLEWTPSACGTDSSYQIAQTFIFSLVSSISFPHQIWSSTLVGPSKATSARWLLFQAPCLRREKSTMKLRASASVRPRTPWRVSRSETQLMTRTRFSANDRWASPRRRLASRCSPLPVWLLRFRANRSGTWLAAWSEVSTPSSKRPSIPVSNRSTKTSQQCYRYRHSSSARLVSISETTPIPALSRIWFTWNKRPATKREDSFFLAFMNWRIFLLKLTAGWS